jgi:hypothetical protein
MRPTTTEIPVMRCDKCERPAALCECCGDVEVVSSTVTVYHINGSNRQAPAVTLAYGSIVIPARTTASGEHRPARRVPQGGQSSVFFDEESAGFLAETFADFLNSDAIFECVIPKQFLV